MEAFIFVSVLLLALVTAFRHLRKKPSEPVRPATPPLQKTAERPRPPVETIPVGDTLMGPAYVIDGDTIVVKKINIRLFGIDAPELDDPYGRKAKFAMVGLCRGQTITAHVTDTDGYGRTVANCYLPDGRDLSAEMVKQGHAVDWPKFSGGIYTQYEVPGIRKKLWRCDALQKGRLASRIPD